MSNITLTLSVINIKFAVCKLSPREDVPLWAKKGPYYSITYTPDELSIICPAEHVPYTVICVRDWCALKIVEQFDLSQPGILVAVTAPLAQAGIGIVAIGTYNTDYVFIKESQFKHAVSILSGLGHNISEP